MTVTADQFSWRSVHPIYDEQAEAEKIVSEYSNMLEERVIASAIQHLKSDGKLSDKEHAFEQTVKVIDDHFLTINNEVQEQSLMIRSTWDKNSYTFYAPSDFQEKIINILMGNS